MLTNQNYAIDGNNVTLQNTFDIGTAKSLVHDRTQEGGEGNGTFRAMGHIPPEMWAYDPWLIQANKARACGDLQSYGEYIRKFFDIHTSLKIDHRQKFFGGWG